MEGHRGGPSPHNHDPLIELPTFQPEEWLTLDAALDWEQACAAIGASRSQLRRALDQGRRRAGPATLNVEGVCNGVRFHAERPTSKRGVAWRFYLHRGVKNVDTRVADLRGTLSFAVPQERRRVTGKLLRPWQWLRLPWRRAG